MNRRDLFRRALAFLGLGAIAKAKPSTDFDQAPPETPYIWPEEKAPGEPPYSVPKFANYELEYERGIGETTMHISAERRPTRYYFINRDYYLARPYRDSPPGPLDQKL